jgi:hypothetical protein
VNDASSESDGGGRVSGADRPPPFSLDAIARASGTRRGSAGPAARALAVGLALLLLPAGCRPRRSGDTVTASPARPLVDVLAARTPEWMSIPGVVGTAESRLDDGRPCILVLVVRLTPELRRAIPETIEGWPVRIEETGEIRAMPDSGR